MVMCEDKLIYWDFSYSLYLIRHLSEREAEAMNKRQIKKQARNLLTGKPVRGICFHANVCFSEDGTLKVAEYVPVNERFCKALADYTDNCSSLELPFFLSVKNVQEE